MNDLQLSLLNDNTVLSMSVPTSPRQELRIEADELDDLIRQLIEVRSAMLPAVPMADDLDPGARVNVGIVGRWFVSNPTKEGKLDLLILHPGARWIGIEMDQGSVANLINELNRRLLLAQKSP